MLRVLLLTSAVVAATFLSGTSGQAGDNKRDDRFAKGARVIGNGQEPWNFWSQSVERSRRPAPGQALDTMPVIRPAIQQDIREVSPLGRVRPDRERRPLIQIRRVPNEVSVMSRRVVARRSR
jgi:hypothetical protein